MSLRDALPKESIIHYWCDGVSDLATPDSFSVVSGCGGLGALLKRDVYIDQVKFSIFGNISVLFVAPSGVGKDTIISTARSNIIALSNRSRIIGGNTPEMIKDAMVQIGDPACAFLPAGELSEFIGTQDYKGSEMVKVLTDILSGNDYIDTSIKSKQGQFIRRPTLTMFAGSTVEWLHSNMPVDSNEGGFYPRFVVLVEDEPAEDYGVFMKSIPPAIRAKADHGMANWKPALAEVLQAYDKFGEIRATRSAEDKISAWYKDRKNVFPNIANKYAVRAGRNHAIRLALVSAVSRFSKVITIEDSNFAIAVMNQVARRVEEVFAPPTVEYKMIKEIFGMLPISKNKLYGELQKRYKTMDISRVWNHLLESNQIVYKDKMLYRGDN